MRLPAQTGGATKHAAVGVVERLLGDELVHRVRGAPLVGDHRVGEVVEVRVPGVLVELLQLGRVLDGVAVGVEEVAEGVVAGHVAAGPPDLLDAGRAAAGRCRACTRRCRASRTRRGAARRAGRGRSRGCGGSGLRPQEPHHLAHVRDASGCRRARSARWRCVEGHGGLGVRRVDDDVGELDRDRLAFLDLAVLADGDVGGHLDGAAVDVEEPEAVAAAGRLELVGLGDELDAGACRAARPARRRRPRLAAPKEMRSRRFSSSLRRRTAYCSGEPSAARKAMPRRRSSPALRPHMSV